MNKLKTEEYIDPFKGNKQSVFTRLERSERQPSRDGWHSYVLIRFYILHLKDMAMIFYVAFPRVIIPNIYLFNTMSLIMLPVLSHFMDIFSS